MQTAKANRHFGLVQALTIIVFFYWGLSAWHQLWRRHHRNLHPVSILQWHGLEDHVAVKGRGRSRHQTGFSFVER